MDDVNKLLKEALSSEQTKALLKQFGFAPSLPYVVSTIEDELVYSPNDIAKLLGYSRQQICRLCREGIIMSFQISSKSKHCIFGEEVKRFILSKLSQPAFLQKIFTP